MMFSDLADGLTYSRAHGGFVHPAAYYAKAGRRETEIFANIVSVYGSCPMGQRMLEQFVPALTRLVLKMLENIE